MSKEYTFVLIKPDVFEKQQAGLVFRFIETVGLEIVFAEVARMSREFFEQFYVCHCGKSFVDNLVRFMSSGPVMALVLKGHNAIVKMRDAIGHTDSSLARPNTIRSLYGSRDVICRNAIHASDSQEGAEYELKLWLSYMIGSILKLQGDAKSVNLEQVVDAFLRSKGL